MAVSDRDQYIHERIDIGKRADETGGQWQERVAKQREALGKQYDALAAENTEGQPSFGGDADENAPPQPAPNEE